MRILLRVKIDGDYGIIMKVRDTHTIYSLSEKKEFLIMPNIEHLQIVNVSPSLVYEALTTSKGLSNVWTNELSVENQVGSINEFRFGDNDITKMQILELERNHKIVWKCVDSDPEWIDTLISFDIEEKKS